MFFFCVFYYKNGYIGLLVSFSINKMYKKFITNEFSKIGWTAHSHLSPGGWRVTCYELMKYNILNYLDIYISFKTIRNLKVTWITILEINDINYKEIKDQTITSFLACNLGELATLLPMWFIRWRFKFLTLCLCFALQL